MKKRAAFVVSRKRAVLLIAKKRAPFVAKKRAPFVAKKRAALVAAVLLLSLAITALGQPTRLPAHIVWTQGDRIYLAAPDSVHLDPGTHLIFNDKKKAVATGEILGVYEQTFILAKLTSGSFKKVKHPDRLIVFTEPKRPKAPPKLRIGYPSSKRGTLFFACDSVGIDLPSAGFGAVRSSDHLYQLTRNPAVPDTASWPDTLIVRFFDDAADEEIALERNEIDAAVFWPGEPSTHIRDKLRWGGEPSGLRQRGIVAALFLAFHPTVDSLSTATTTRRIGSKLNDELFRGDLAPCGTSVVDTTAALTSSPLRFDVDSRLPGHDNLQKCLDRSWKSNTVAKAADLVRITYLDLPLDSLTTPLSISGITDNPTKISAVACLFRIRCPIMCSAAARPAVEAMGPDNIVSLLRCRARGAP